MIENEQQTQDTKDNLMALRQEIDTIDKALIALLSERFEHAVKIAEIKQQQGTALYDPDREAQILRQLSASLGAHESLFEIVSVFEALLNLSKKAQAKHLDKLNSIKKDLL